MFGVAELGLVWYLSFSPPYVDIQSIELCKIDLPKYVVVKERRVEYMTLECTAYWHLDPVDASGTGITCTGNKCIPYKTLAVDPRIIPFGSEVFFYSSNETYIADDSGGAIKGYKADKAMDSRQAAFKYGRRIEHVKVIYPKYTYSIKEVD